MSGYGKVDTNDDSGGGELSSNKCCELIGDLIYGVSPEKKRGRNFYRKQLPMLRAGGMFKLIYVGKSRGSSTLAAAATNYASSVLGMFSGNSNNNNNNNNNNETGNGLDTSSKAKLGEGIWLSIIKDDTTLEWKTLANIDNQPKAMQQIPLYQITRASRSHCTEKSSEAETRRLILEDNNGDRIVSRAAQKAFQNYKL